MRCRYLALQKPARHNGACRGGIAAGFRAIGGALQPCAAFQKPDRHNGACRGGIAAGFRAIGGALQPCTAFQKSDRHNGACRGGIAAGFRAISGALQPCAAFQKPDRHNGACRGGIAAGFRAIGGALRPCAALAVLIFAGAGIAWTADYTGPRPPKPDMLYLVHADNLIPTESGEAKEEGKGGNSKYTMPGAASPARTPLAEPIFILQSDKLPPESIELYKFDVKGGRREVDLSGGRGSAKALHLAVTRLERGLYRIEADEVLDNGEYVLSPMGSNRVFCFEIY